MSAISTRSEAPSHFAGLGLDEQVLRAIREQGLVCPTSIQTGTIPPALRGRDLLGLSGQGTGKTTAIAIALAGRLKESPAAEALVITPAGGMAQMDALIGAFRQRVNLTMVALHEDTSMRSELRALERRPNIIIATPQRLAEHARQRSFRLADIDILAIDDADQILEPDFLPELSRIICGLAERRHVMMFATVSSPPVETIARTLRFPERIDLRSATPHLSTVEHRVYLVRQEHKRACLLALVQQEQARTLVLARRDTDAEWLYQMLEGEKFSVERTHSGRTPLKRGQAIEQFRSGIRSVLVAADAGDAPVDVRDVRHLINFDAPATVSGYLRRSHRTGVVAPGGVISTIATWKDIATIRAVETAVGQRISHCRVPGIEPWVDVK